MDVMNERKPKRCGKREAFDRFQSRFWRCAAVMSWSCDHVHTCVCEIQASGARVQQRGGLTRFLSWFERHAPKTAPPDHRSLHKALGVNPNQCQSISPIWLLKCRKISIKPRVKMSTDRGKDTLWRFLKIAPYLQFHCSIDKSQIES